MTMNDRPPWAARLQAEREARGWTKPETARRLQRASGHPGGPTESLVRQIRDWERGKHFPRDWTADYAKAFGTTEEDLFGTAPIVPVDRRTVLGLGVAAGAAPFTHHPHKGPVDPELVLYFLEQLPGHYRADMFLGPRHLIPTVSTQAQLIDELVRAADGPVRRGLLGAGVAYSALLGWLYQDAGDLNGSSQWRNIALDMAHRSGDQQLISYALTNKAMLAVDLGDGRAIVDYAEAALADERKLCPKVRVLGLVHKAHGHSFLGRDHRAAVDQALDAAAGLIDQVDDEHPWGNSCRRTARYVDVQRATAYVRLGAHREAVDMWERILGSVPASARRDNGVFWTRQATALAAVPDPDRVVEIAASTATIVAETGSARLQRELMTLPTAAAGWKSTRAGRELGEIIAAIA
ncbi:hypothetical protein GCM10027589_06790 [Actinocorallia lasiicapitis]